MEKSRLRGISPSILLPPYRNSVWFFGFSRFLVSKNLKKFIKLKNIHFFTGLFLWSITKCINVPGMLKNYKKEYCRANFLGDMFLIENHPGKKQNLLRWCDPSKNQKNRYRPHDFCTFTA